MSTLDLLKAKYPDRPELVPVFDQFSAVEESLKAMLDDEQLVEKALNYHGRWIAMEEQRKTREAEDKLKAIEQARITEERRTRNAAHEREIREQRKEQQAKAEAERRRLLIEKREVELCRLVPYDFKGAAVEDSPRPEQCRFVANACTAPDGVLWTEEWCGLLLFGASGTGKTAASWMLFQHHWRDHVGNHVEFIRTVDFTYASKAKHQTSGLRKEFDSLFDRLLGCDLLILDDLGTEKLTEATEEVFYRLLNNRFDDRLMTVVSSNLTAGGISNLFGRRNQPKIKRRLEQFLLPINFDTV